MNAMDTVVGFFGVFFAKMNNCMMEILKLES